MTTTVGLLILLAGCGGGEDSESDGGDADSDVDADSDADTDVGTDLPNDCPTFPEDNPWNTDVSGYDLHPDSDAFIDSIGRDAGFHADFGANLYGSTFGIPWFHVQSSTPRVPVAFRYGDQSDPGPYPFPPNALVEGGPDSDGDRHVIAVDVDACILYETWDSWPIDGGASWEAGSGAIFDLRSNDLRPDGWTSADAAGLPIYPGLVRYDEVVEDGVIDHALRFTVELTQHGYVHPATHYAADSIDPYRPPMGLRLRMKADYDCGDRSSEVQVICTALKAYGMIVADNGSNWYLSGAPDTRWNDEAMHSIDDITGDAMEVVDTGPIVTN